MKPIFSLLSLITALALPSLAAPSATVTDTLQQQWAKWRAGRPPHYTYELSYVCFCSPSDRWRVEAEGDSVIRVVPIGGNLGYWPTLQSYSIDSVFARIRRDIDTKPAHIHIGYDETYGFPASAMVDPDAGMADEEYGYAVSNFKLVPLSTLK